MQRGRAVVLGSNLSQPPGAKLGLVLNARAHLMNGLKGVKYRLLRSLTDVVYIETVVIQKNTSILIRQTTRHATSKIKDVDRYFCYYRR